MSTYTPMWDDDVIDRAWDAKQEQDALADDELAPEQRPVRRWRVLAYSGDMGDVRRAEQQAATNLAGKIPW